DLPDFAAFALGTNHGCVCLTTPCLLKLGQIRKRADHSVLRDRVRVGLHHQALRLDANLVPTELSPGDKELLFGSKSVDVRRTRFALERLLVGEVSDLRAAQVTNALAQHEFAVVVYTFLD